MNILFIYKDCNREIIGPMIISSILRNAGFSTELVEAKFGLIKREIQRYQNCILAYSTPTVFSYMFLDLNRKLKSQFPHIVSLFGGPHPTFFPEMIEEEGVDGVCIGEGEYAMLELVRNLSEGKPITHIQNWWIKQDGQIYKNPLRPLIEDLDSLPFPDRSYSKHILSFKMGRASIITSRGCPYQCSYCFNHAYNRLYNNPSGRVRRRSVDNVIKEIQQLKSNFPLRMIIFQDDTFILDRGWLEEFSDKYKREVDLPFWCLVQSELVTRDSIRLLRNAGCSMVGMGVECGNEYYRNEILRRNITVEQILRAAEIIGEEKIGLRTHNLVGLPGATLDMELETIRLNIRCKPVLARASVLSAYPKTDIFITAKKHGFVENSFSSHFTGANWTLNRKNISALEIRKLDNLSCLFPLFVRFPFLLHFVKAMVVLPTKWMFVLINKFCESCFPNFNN